MKIQDKDFKLEFDYNSICEIERVSGKGLTSLFSEDVIGFNTLRMLVWAGLQKNHKGYTIERAGLIIEKYIEEHNDAAKLFEEIMQALEKAGFMGKQSPREEI